MTKYFRIKYIENNNTILIEKKWNAYADEEKGSKPKFQWWYEIDLDDASPERLEEWKKHLQGKIWIEEDPYILEEIEAIYRERLEINK